MFKMAVSKKLLNLRTFECRLQLTAKASIHLSIGTYIYFTTICRKIGVPENPIPDDPET